VSAFDDVIARPRSIAARRELAREWRANGDPRAELIERQLKEHDGLGMLSRETVPGEIRKLVKEHGRQWAGKIADIANGYSYELGVIATINIDGDKLIQHAAELVRMAPIVHMVIEPPIDLVAVSAVPELAQVSTLTLREGPWLHDDAIEAFANSPNIRGLRALDVQAGNLTQRGFAALVASPHLSDIVYIDITDNPGAGSGRLGTLLERRYYLLWSAADPYIERAYEAAAQSYTAGLHEWPPSDAEITYEE
jgi:hypothetical protein